MPTSKSRHVQTLNRHDDALRHMRILSPSIHLYLRFAFPEAKPSTGLYEQRRIFGGFDPDKARVQIVVANGCRYQRRGCLGIGDELRMGKGI